MKTIVEIDSDVLITKSFKEVYPMKSETIEIIITSLHAKLLSQKVGNNLIADGLLDDTVIIILRDAKAVKQPRLTKIIKDLESASISSAIIIASFFSSGCYKVIEDSDYKIINIEEFFDKSVKDTVKPKLGKYASKGTPGVKTETVVLRIPTEGYPELGLPGPLYAEDIYKIIENKIKTIKSGNDDKVVIEVAKLFIDAFTKCSELLSSGKSITFEKWNTIMESVDIYKYLETNGEKIEEIIKNDDYY